MVDINYELSKVFCESSKTHRSRVKLLLKKYKLIEYKCICGLVDSWNNKELKLELDHVNGIRNDNRLANLRFICPNCHSQTKTYKRKNGKREYTDNQFIEVVLNSYSINEVCNRLNISNANHYSIKNKIKKFDISLKIREEKEKNKCECGKEIFRTSEYCEKCYQVKSRKVERPDISIVISEVEQFGFCAVGRKYGVSDNAIRKWIKNASVVKS